MNKNPQEYISNCLNTSLSKFAHSFSKADRFGRINKIQTQVKYTLPSTITRRTCSFGFGNKSSLIIERNSPPPGTYQSLSEFNVDKIKLNTPLFGYAREKVLFGSYMDEAKKKGQKVPSPNKYHIKVPKSRTGGHMGIRLKTEPNNKQSKNCPGPGTYNLNSIEMANSSSFFLSTFKKAASPKYHSISSIEIDTKRKKNKSVLFYDVEEKEFGMSKSSKFRNVTKSSFGKQKRQSLVDKWKLQVPGFKYAAFSEFGSLKK